MVGREQRTENEANYPIVRMIIPGLNSPKIPSVSDFLRALGPADGAGHQLPLAPGSGHPDIALCRPPVVGKESQQTQNSSSPLTPPTHTHTHTHKWWFYVTMKEKVHSLYAWYSSSIHHPLCNAHQSIPCSQRPGAEAAGCDSARSLHARVAEIMHSVLPPKRSVEKWVFEVVVCVGICEHT